MKSLRRKTRRGRSKKRTPKRTPNRTSRRTTKRSQRRTSRRTQRRTQRRTSRRLMKGGMTREEINQYCATKQGLEKRLCEDLPKLLENNSINLNDIDSGDLEFLIDKWKHYITANFENIKNKLYFEDDEDDEDDEDNEDNGINRLNNFLENKDVTFTVISEAYREGFTGNWEPREFAEVDDDDEGPLQDWLNELYEMKRPMMK